MAAQVDVENRIEIIHDFSTSQGQKRSDLTEGLIWLYPGNTFWSLDWSTIIWVAVYLIHRRSSCIHSWYLRSWCPCSWCWCIVWASTSCPLVLRVSSRWHCKRQTGRASNTSWRRCSAHSQNYSPLEQFCLLSAPKPSRPQSTSASSCSKSPLSTPPCRICLPSRHSS